MLDLLIGILYTLRRWRALVAWAFTAALIYPVLTYVPDSRIAWFLAVAIAIVGFFGGLYWEAKSGSN